MIIALFLNNTKPLAQKIAQQVITFLKARQVTVLAEEEEASLLGVAPLHSVDSDSIDFCISLGGDGTILRLVHRHPQINSPLLGINLGGLGFLADVPIEDIDTCLQDLIDGKYRVQKRVTMEGIVDDNRQSFSVNDIVFHRAQNPSLVELSIHVDGRYLNTFLADGIILATPTGSTAYSLAAGGPILSPELVAFVLTPICPHTVSNRPLVLFPKQQIVIGYTSSDKTIEVNFDGVQHFALAPNEQVTIRPSSRFFSLVSFPHHDYFTTLRNKLHWTGKLISKKS